MKREAGNVSTELTFGIHMRRLAGWIGNSVFPPYVYVSFSLHTNHALQITC
jgi:hypothetical protein